MRRLVVGCWLALALGCGGGQEPPSPPSKTHSNTTSPVTSEAVVERAEEPALAATAPTAPVTGAEAIAEGRSFVAIPPGAEQRLVMPGSLHYEGAFRFPEPAGESTWEYSGYAMTYRPDGDPNGGGDGYPGSLYVVGHDHHQLVAEIGIPAPQRSSSRRVEELPAATTLQPFHDVRGGMFGELEIPRAGLAYLPAQTGQDSAKLHFAWGQHFEDDRRPTHGWCELDLSRPAPAGPWRLDGFTNYITNDYLFEIPEAWATANAPGLRLATGRFRDGEWGGLGPALLAYGPWLDGAPPEPNATLEHVRPLLLYGESLAGEVEIARTPERRMRNYSPADEWTGGAWLTNGEQSAVVLVGTKAIGRAWYGFSNGVEYPLSGDPNEPVPDVPPWPHDARGWWSSEIEAQLLFFDPDELARVARGEAPAWSPQPYASRTLDADLLNPGFDYPRQKRYLVGDMAYDRERARLFIVERQADATEVSVVHVYSLARPH